MALEKIYIFNLDLQAKNSLSLPNIVSGDTGNIFKISVMSGDVAVDLTGSRVRLVITNIDGQGAQDSELQDSGITIGGDQTNLVTCKVFSSMLSNGVNSGLLEIYTKSAGQNEWDTLVTTNAFTFNARNCPSEKAAQFPSLIASEKKSRFISGFHYVGETLYMELSDFNGTYVEDVEIGAVGNPALAVRYDSQTPTSDQQTQARSNIDAAKTAHAHGNITSDGKISGKANYLLETNASGAIGAFRRIVVTSSDPTGLQDLSDGDIVLYDKPFVLGDVPDVPTTDGTYSLQASVSDGVVTFSWV